MFEKICNLTKIAVLCGVVICQGLLAIDEDINDSSCNIRTNKFNTLIGVSLQEAKTDVNAARKYVKMLQDYKRSLVKAILRFGNLLVDNHEFIKSREKEIKEINSKRDAELKEMNESIKEIKAAKKVDSQKIRELEEEIRQIKHDKHYLKNYKWGKDETVFPHVEKLIKLHKYLLTCAVREKAENRRKAAIMYDKSLDEDLNSVFTILKNSSQALLGVKCLKTVREKLQCIIDCCTKNLKMNHPTADIPGCLGEIQPDLMPFYLHYREDELKASLDKLREFQSKTNETLNYCNKKIEQVRKSHKESLDICKASISCNRAEMPEVIRRTNARIQFFHEKLFRKKEEERELRRIHGDQLDSLPEKA